MGGKHLQRQACHQAAKTVSPLERLDRTHFAEPVNRSIEK